MKTLEQIRALAAQGIGRKATEATIGRAMSADELDAWRKAPRPARTAWRSTSASATRWAKSRP